MNSTDSVNLKFSNLPEQLQQWQDYYNRLRKHGSIHQTPWHKWEALQALTLAQKEVRDINSTKKELELPTIAWI